MNKAKFVKIDVNVSLNDYEPYSFTEWFCLDETWTHPYNTRDARAKEFQAWCKENWDFENEDSVCPEVMIGGAKLNDGWGSDCVERIAGIIAGMRVKNDNAEAFYNAIETALETGEKASLELEDARGSMTVRLEPSASIVPDEDSIAAFGPYADRVHKELAEA